MGKSRQITVDPGTPPEDSHEEPQFRKQHVTCCTQGVLQNQGLAVQLRGTKTKHMDPKVCLLYTSDAADE